MTTRWKVCGIAALLIAAACPPGGIAATPCTTVVVPTGVGFSAPTSVESFNPLLSTALVAHQVERLLLRPMLQLTPAFTIDFAKSLASGIEVLDGGQTYRVTLRGWLWSDGAPVSADDAAYSFELIRKLGHIYPNAGEGGVPDLVARFTVLNPHQFEIHLTRAVNPEWFELNGLNSIIPLPRHVWKDMSTDEMWRRQSDPSMFAVSDGPFLIETVALSRYISFVPNPRYGGEQPRIRRFVLDFLQGGDAFGAFASGEVDISNVPYALIAKARTLPDTILIAPHPAFTYFTISLNLKNDAAPFFADVRVRQAMADAIDRADMVRVVFRGFGAPLHSPVPTQPDTFLSPDAKAGRFPVGYDPAKARRLLAAAGFAPGADGMQRKDGKKLEFEALLTAGGTSGPQIAQFIQRNLAAVGIDMHIKQMEFNQMLALAFGPPAGWQAEFIGWTIYGYPDGQQNFSTDGGLNIAHYSDPTMDRLVRAVNFGADRQPLFVWQDYAAAQQPSIFFTDGNIPVITRPGLAGVRDFINPDGALQPEALTITDPNFCHAAHDRRPS